MDGMCVGVYLGGWDLSQGVSEQKEKEVGERETRPWGRRCRSSSASGARSAAQSAPVSCPSGASGTRAATPTGASDARATPPTGASDTRVLASRHACGHTSRRK
eukprot:2773133-Rhodomonas_salina.1